MANRVAGWEISLEISTYRLTSRPDSRTPPSCCARFVPVRSRISFYSLQGGRVGSELFRSGTDGVKVYEYITHAPCQCITPLIFRGEALRPSAWTVVTALRRTGATHSCAVADTGLLCSMCQWDRTHSYFSRWVECNPGPPGCLPTAFH